LASSDLQPLVPFFQEQFRFRRDWPGVWWCWETLLEKVAIHCNIPLDADRLTYAAGNLRTGRYTYRCKDHKWRRFTDCVIKDERAALQVVEDVSAALRCCPPPGIAGAWLAQTRARIDANDICGSYAIAMLCGPLMRYHANGEYCPELANVEGIIYGLWRLNESGDPVMPFPVYVGETGGSMRSRIEGAKGHLHWWGPGKSMGVTLRRVSGDRSERQQLEERVIANLIPFSNVKRRRNFLSEVWPSFVKAQQMSAACVEEIS
jgi:hypothetical protein